MMMDRCSYKVAITSQDRSQPMDKWEDYPSKVLDIAPLIMVTLPTVSSFFSTCGCFLRDGRSSSGDLPPLFLACGWPPGGNGSLLCEWRHFQGFWVKDPSGARKGGPNRPSEWVRPAGLGRPAKAHPDPVQSPLRSLGPQWLCTLSLPFAWFRLCHPRVQMEVLRAWSSVFYASIPGVFLRSTSVLATIGSDFIKLMNMNKTP
jgi:hypothetical protein